ncbi:MAG: DNA repair protein RecO [Parachlamydiaceae bacterium]|nr:DNA repair protein RecO [Parachlamydiaceae bacterium]
MEKLRIEGLIIKATPFQDYDRIISVLTPNEGLIKFFFKGSAAAKNNNASSTTPLTVVELIYSKGRSELLKCHEISILNHNLALRNNLAILETACDMLQVVNATQMPGKACSNLYQLLLTFLKNLPTAHDPATLGSSFRLKTLRSEGLWKNFSSCNQCGCDLMDSYNFEGNTYCKLHTPPHALEISSSERDIFELLAFSRDLPLLNSLPMTQDLINKIKHLFNDLWST